MGCSGTSWIPETVDLIVSEGLEAVVNGYSSMGEKYVLLAIYKVTVCRGCYA